MSHVHALMLPIRLLWAAHTATEVTMPFRMRPELMGTCNITHPAGHDLASLFSRAFDFFFLIAICSLSCELCSYLGRKDDA